MSKENRMFKTKNDLPEDIRGQVIEIMNARLADAIDLKTQAKQAHWNVKGISFIGLHELFDQIATDADEYVDLIAERVVQLGGTALGTARVAAAKSNLSEYPLDISESAAHVDALSNALSTFGKHVRESIDETDNLQDADAADILTEISRGVDKYLWFVEAHQQA